MIALLAIAVIVADQVTKFLAGSWGWVSLNGGISFGLLENVPSYVLSLSLLIMIFVSWVVYRRAWQKEPLAAGFFLGGAVSNLIDRILWSGVRDWLPLPGTNLHNNLADYAILIGLALLIVHTFVHTANPPAIEKEEI